MNCGQTASQHAKLNSALESPKIQIPNLPRHSEHRPPKSHAGPKWPAHKANIYIYTYTLIYIYIYIHVYIHVYTFTCVYIYIYVYTYICMYMYIHISIYIHVYIHVYTHIYIYIYVYTFTYIYIHPSIAKIPESYVREPLCGISSHLGPSWADLRPLLQSTCHEYHLLHAAGTPEATVSKYGLTNYCEPLNSQANLTP